MRIFTAFKLAILGLWANRFRVLFSMMGVVIGIFAVVVLSAIAIGVKDTLLKQMGGLGAEQVLVLPGRVLDSAGGQKDFISGLTSVPSTLTYEDAKEVEQVKNVRSVIPQLETITTLKYQQPEKRKQLQTVLIGTTGSYPRVQHAELAEGRFFTEEENQAKAKVVVLGKNVHDGLLEREEDQPPDREGVEKEKVEEDSVWKKVIRFFTTGSAAAAEEEPSLVGKQVELNGQAFQVVGVLKENATLGASTDNNTIMPVQTALDVTSMKNLNRMIVEAESTDVIDQVDEDVFAAIKTRHNDIDFSVVKQEQMLEALDKITSILQIMLAGITLTALFISGMGIMNVMAMSVRERTREIGIRKALGATTVEVMYQFFFETLLLCLLGGLAGIGFGYAFIEIWNGNIDVFLLVLPIWAVKIALISSLVIGVLFGIYPALKAARMNPSKSLRHE